MALGAGGEDPLGIGDRDAYRCKLFVLEFFFLCERRFFLVFHRYSCFVGISTCPYMCSSFVHCCPALQSRCPEMGKLLSVTSVCCSPSIFFCSSMVGCCLCFFFLKSLVSQFHNKSTHHHAYLMKPLPTDATQETLIADVVAHQRSSPCFAEFCVSHVTDRRYAFLFDERHPLRRKYEAELLRSQRNAESVMVGGSKRPRSDDEESCALESIHSPNSIVEVVWPVAGGDARKSQCRVDLLELRQLWERRDRIHTPHHAHWPLSPQLTSFVSSTWRAISPVGTAFVQEATGAQNSAAMLCEDVAVGLIDTVKQMRVHWTAYGWILVATARAVRFTVAADEDVQDHSRLLMPLVAVHPELAVHISGALWMLCAFLLAAAQESLQSSKMVEKELLMEERSRMSSSSSSQAPSIQHAERRHAAWCVEMDVVLLKPLENSLMLMAREFRATVVCAIASCSAFASGLCRRGQEDLSPAVDTVRRRALKAMLSVLETWELHGVVSSATAAEVRREFGIAS